MIPGEQVFLVLVVKVKRPLGDLRPRGDIFHPHLVERALREELDRRINDPPHLRGIGRSHASPHPATSTNPGILPPHTAAGRLARSKRILPDIARLLLCEIRPAL